MHPFATWIADNKDAVLNLLPQLEEFDEYSPWALSDYFKPLVEAYNTQAEDGCYIYHVGTLDVTEDYQGDLLIAFDGFFEVWYSLYSYGSCSGCDAIMACENKQDLYICLLHIAQSMHRAIS